MPGQTPSQTVGPFFAYGLTPARCGLGALASAQMFPPDAPGTPIRIVGRVLDGDGARIPDALIEAFQADAAGAFRGGTCGFGRSETDADGAYAFATIRPGAIGPGHAPHVGLIVFMRGLLTHLFTRLYFPEDLALHATDPVLARVPLARRNTLVAEREGACYRLDIRMQGAGETVFLEF